MARIQIIDLVRSLAIFLIMVEHYFGSLPSSIQPESRLASLLEYYSVNGRLGVSLFFMISGFLITQALNGAPDQPFKTRVFDFYARRAARIYPLLFLAVMFGLGMYLFQERTSPFQESIFRNPGYHYDLWFWTSIFFFFFNLNITFIQPGEMGLFWRVLWFLSVEEQFYFAIPWALRFLQKGRSFLSFLLALVFLGTLWRVFFTFYHSSGWVRLLNSFGYFDQIAIGAILSFLLAGSRNYLSQRPREAQWICALGLVMMLATYLHLDFNRPSDLNIGYILSPPFFAFGGLLFLLGGIHLGFFGSRVLGPFALPGKLSYGCYLFHTAVLDQVTKRFGQLDPLIGLPVYLAATLLIAQASHSLLEKPLNLAVRNLLSRLKPSP